MLCNVFEQAGLPPGVVNMVFGNGPNAGSPLTLHPKVSAISFTGGTVTGKLVYQAAAQQNKKVSLELGGKNANIIFADADLDKAVATSIRSSFSNQGEICLCGSRIFVHESIYSQFLKMFVTATSHIVVGDPLDPNTNMGALVSEQHLHKVLEYINIAQQEGGKIEHGGARLTSAALANGYYLSPTIITGLDPINSRLQKEEIFGPVVTVTPFFSEESVVKFANATEYGLAASIWTQNVSVAHRVASKLQVGTVWVNTWMNREYLYLTKPKYAVWRSQK
jgi:aminomuconate-semialdehyde/2-hydroxymuconate-6-semialdehyde dehydrogenase